MEQWFNTHPYLVMLGLLVVGLFVRWLMRSPAEGGEE